jgi:tetratricopeptide (TPR) repeat protein
MDHLYFIHLFEHLPPQEWKDQSHYPAMLPSHKRAVLGSLLLAIAFSATLLAQPIGNQEDPPVKEPVDSSAQEAISNGVSAFKDARYAAAIQHFNKAVALDPKSTQARLYLGIAYSNQVVPNVDTPENLATAKTALDIFKQIPEGAPEYISALRHIAFLYHNIKRFDEAKATELQLLKLVPTDAAANFTIGVIDWRQAYQNAVQVLATANLTDDGTGNPKLTKSACLELRGQNAILVKDGIDHLTRAIALKPDNENAIQYLNLTYRRQADLACGDESKRTQSVTLAEQSSQKAMLLQKQNQSATPPSQ